MYLFNLLKLNYYENVQDFSALQHIPAMQRRRLSNLAKLALHTARQTLQDQPQVDYIVWSSCYGEEHKTVDILNEIVLGQMPSPTQFSTSVHNAIAGLYSILFKDHTLSTSLSSCWQHCIEDAVMEAYGYLKTHQKQSALIVYYDEPLPSCYQREYGVDQSLALGMVISLDDPNVMLKKTALTNIQIPQHALEFSKFWQSPNKEWQSSDWVWQKC